MHPPLGSDKPIYIQVRELLEDMIVTGELQEGDQTPSTTELSNFYKINHITVSKGINQLADEGVLHKKRGVGTFVSKGAREQLLTSRKNHFVVNYVQPMLLEAKNIGLDDIQVDELIKKEREDND